MPWRLQKRRGGGEEDRDRLGGKGRTVIGMLAGKSAMAANGVLLSSVSRGNALSQCSRECFWTNSPASWRWPCERECICMQCDADYR